MSIVYEFEKVGDQFRGLVIDMSSFEVVGRTQLYVHKDAALSAAASMWRAKQAEAQRKQVAA